MALIQFQYVFVYPLRARLPYESFCVARGVVAKAMSLASARDQLLLCLQLDAWQPRASGKRQACKFSSHSPGVWQGTRGLTCGLILQKVCAPLNVTLDSFMNLIT